MVARENVVEQQHNPNLRESGHASAHDPHLPPRYVPGKVLPRNPQQLADGLLIKPRGLTPPLAELTALSFLQDQWMPQKLVNGILIKRDPLAPHPEAFVSDTLLRWSGGCIKLHDYLWVELSHG